jgi:hypothetical protein
MSNPAKQEKSTKDSGEKTKKNAPRKPVAKGAIETLIKQFEDKLRKESVNLSVGEYIRLKQLRKELDVEEPKEIRVTWVEPTEKESVTKT